MDDIQLLGEQPDKTSQGAAAQVNSGVEEVTGSPYGKFNNADELVKAYDNLQSEFTRKCQRLSELEKSNPSDKAVTPQGEDSWHEHISEFLEAHPNARKYASEIADKLYSDKALASQPGSLELAYASILDTKYKPYDQLVQDEEFLANYIYNNSTITGKILDDYLKGYSKAPQLISSTVGASVNMSSAPKASNLREAKELVEQLFK